MVKVLVVEDNKVFGDSLVFELEMRGYEVDKAYDGATAIKLLNAGDTPPDIILSDISMPDVDGYQLLETVRKNETWREIPFLFLTAHNSDQAVRTGKELGVDDYLVKPFDTDDLVIAMENKLRRVSEVRYGAERRLDSTRLQLMQIISHELNTPLQAIVGGAELLEDRFAEVPDESVGEMLSFVRTGVNRLHHVLHNILMFINLSGSNADEDFDELADLYDFNVMVQEAFRAISTEPENMAKQLKFDIGFDSGPALVNGVQEVLNAMVAEPLRNAMTFSPPNGRLGIRVTKDSENVQLLISDEGPGIAQEQLDQVWKPLLQLDRKHMEQQGLGIGLPLVRVGTELHGGECWIESEKGEGVHFYLRIPLAEDQLDG